MLYSRTAQIVLDYLNKDAKNIALLRRCLQNHMKTIQFVYSRCFPEIYSLIDKRRINLKSEFLLTFKAWKDKKKFLPNNSNIDKKLENEQTLQKNIEEDEKVGKQLEEKNLKRKFLAKKNAALKESSKKRCNSQPETSEKELWDRLQVLNKNFKVMKDMKKQSKPKKNLIV